MFKYWTFCVIEPPFGGLETTYDVHLGLLGKRVVDFLLVLIELFFARSYGLRATNENRSKSAISLQRGHFDPKILGRRGHPPPIIFAWIVRPMNALQLCR